MKFTLEITLGNDAMLSAVDVALALREAGNRRERFYDDVTELGDWSGLSGGVRDANGNHVGEWEVTE